MTLKEQVKEQLISYLNEIGVKYLDRPELRSVKVVFGGKDKMGDTYLDFFFLDDETLVMAHYEKEVPDYARMTVMEYINNINKKISDGFFFIDMNDGMVIYENKVKFLEKDHVADTTGPYLFMTSFKACTRFEEGCEKVMNGVMTPQEALEEALKEK